MRECDRCEFSEFSFGYALTDNLVHSNAWGGLNGAPRFLSLSEEGNVGGGFDVMVDFQALPLFLQFKVPQVMRRRFDPFKAYGSPYYRMHLRTRLMNRRIYTQHQQLLELEALYPICVYYVAPRFHDVNELDTHYAAGRVPDFSEWFSPEAIGPLSNEDHHVAYDPTRLNNYDVCSKPSPRSLGRLQVGQVRDALRQGVAKQAPEDSLHWLATIAHTVSERYLRSGRTMSTLRRKAEIELSTIEAAIRREKAAPLDQRSRRGIAVERKARFIALFRALDFAVAATLDTRLAVAFVQ